MKIGATVTCPKCSSTMRETLRLLFVCQAHGCGYVYNARSRFK